MSECLIYYIKEGITRVGSAEANIPQDIQLIGQHIYNEHCIFENRSDWGTGRIGSGGRRDRRIIGSLVTYWGKSSVVPCSVMLCDTLALSLLSANLTAVWRVCLTC